MSSATERHDERTYREHNVTRTATRRDGELIRKPVNPHMQCGCDSCRAHRRRNSVTGVASESKDV